jgi:hypothetical protein
MIEKAWRQDSGDLAVVLTRTREMYEPDVRYSSEQGMPLIQS